MTSDRTYRPKPKPARDAAQTREGTGEPETTADEATPTHDAGSAEAKNLRLLLPGDFTSPEELLAEQSLSDDKKREILKSWVRDLEAGGPHDKNTGAVLDSVRDALAGLDRSGEQEGR